MDDLSKFCCQNPECPDFGKRGVGNLSVCGLYGLNNSRRMLRCTSCKDRFSERKGTPFFGSQLPDETVVSILNHMHTKNRTPGGRPQEYRNPLQRPGGQAC